jgi:hypothetical protein
VPYSSFFSPPPSSGEAMKTVKEPTLAQFLDQVLGYLNFAAGSHDTRFFTAMNGLFAHFSEASGEVENFSEPSNQPKLQPFGNFQYPGLKLLRIRQALETRLAQLEAENETFRDSTQARFALAICFDEILPGYLDHHRDLLCHQTTERLFNSFFVAKSIEAILQYLETDETSRKVEILQRLNNFLGHRPVAVLEGRRIEPYSHERVAPIPLYIREVGVATGRFKDLLERTLQTLSQTDPEILRSAQFDLTQLDEIAIDPRAYDFDHPINKRLNHHFGQWDEHTINRKGYFCRFIVHEVVLESLLERVQQGCAGADGDEQFPYDELIEEAALVLSGTILMGSGVTGNGPGAYDSNTSLNDLIPIIAGYRDQFYEQVILQLPDKHRHRLMLEAEARKQPLGAARQDINARLSHLRAKQLVNCRLASIYARMGYPEASENQSQIVPVASARFLCQIDCLLDAASRAIARNDLATAYQSVPVIMDRLKTGIECGAIVDPWNILGFDANYSLFPALENSVSDHRVFELVELMERIFTLCSRLWSEAAASDQTVIVEAIRSTFLDIVQWWRQFAAHEVATVDAVDADEIFAAAELVAHAMGLWYQGGAAAGDIEFWAQHAELFDSPKSYSLVIEALMQRQDYNTSMALMINWLSQSEELPLQMTDISFNDMLVQWISEQRRLFFERGQARPGAVSRSPSPFSPTEVWNRIRKFYDFLEANAEDYWKVPEFEFPNRLSTSGRSGGSASAFPPATDSPELDGFEEESGLFEDLSDFEEELEQEEGETFEAAYDGMIYRDSTNDGFEGEVFDGSLSSDDELEAEVSRVLDRLEFLSALANYWAIAATIPLPVVRQSELNDEFVCRLRIRRDIFEPWLQQAEKNRVQLQALLNSIQQNFSLPRGASDFESILHYDQLRFYKDTLLEQAIHTTIETENAHRMLQAMGRSIDILLEGVETPLAAGSQDTRSIGSDPFVPIFAAILLQDIDAVKESCQKLSDVLMAQPFLYVPVGKGGDPEAIVKTRSLQIAMLDLARHLPALGLFTETYRLVNTTLFMERKDSVGSGAVTEFDELFEVAFTSMVHTLIESTNQFKSERKAEGNKPELAITEGENLLFSCTERLVEAMLAIWLDHSQTLRISVLEKVRDTNSWERLVDFIQTYGEGIFTQQFLHRYNIRGILHQGVENWLEQLQEASSGPDWRLLDEIHDRLQKSKAVRYLTVVLEAVLENYNEYLDYNSTTTQSDHGNYLFMFLDFLRLRSRYDRICWNLKPVIWAHSIFVNNQENNVARRWRRSLNERLASEAEKYLTLLDRLRQKYSMRMESIGRRLEGRFGHQMQIDRLCALVAPAMQSPETTASQRKFELLRQQAQTFAESTNGVGVDLPAWLAALENEVDQFQILARFKEDEKDPPLPPPIQVPISQLQMQLLELPGRPLFE